MNILFVVTYGQSHVRISNTTYILCKKDNGLMLKNTVIEKINDSFKLMLVSMTFNNKRLHITNIYITDDRVFLEIILGKEHVFPK